MIKNTVAAILLFLVAQTAIAQNIVKGVVKDILTNEPVGSVTVSTHDQLYGTVSNDEGAFALSCPASAKSIILSHLSYKSLEVALGSLPADSVYYLEQQHTELDEIIIPNQPVHELLEKLRASSIAQFSQPLQLSTYYREFVKTNSNYTKFSDALIDYSVFRKGKKMDSELVVKQSRAIKLQGADEETYDAVSPLDVRTAVNKDYAFKALDLLLNGKEYKKYDFVIKSRTDRNGEVMEYIIFEPKPEVQEALYSGTIAYDPKSQRILEFDFIMAESHKKYIRERNFLIIKGSLTDVVYRSRFKIVGDRYLLSLSVRDMSMNIRNKRTINEDFKFRSDLIVTNFTTDVVKFNKKERYKEKSLYENGTKYTEKFWVGNNSIVLTAEEESILKSLENKQ